MFFNSIIVYYFFRFFEQHYSQRPRARSSLGLN
jgi:hypothetical protein